MQGHTEQQAAEGIDDDTDEDMVRAEPGTDEEEAADAAAAGEYGEPEFDEADTDDDEYLDCEEGFAYPEVDGGWADEQGAEDAEDTEDRPPVPPHTANSNLALALLSARIHTTTQPHPWPCRPAKHRTVCIHLHCLLKTSTAQHITSPGWILQPC